MRNLGWAVALFCVVALGMLVCTSPAPPVGPLGAVTRNLPVVNGNVVTYDTANGRFIQDSGVGIAGLVGGPFLPLAGGTMAANIVMGGNLITGLGAAVAAGDVPRFDQTFTGATDDYEWTVGNVWYVEAGNDINAAVAVAAAGDTLVLAAGAYIRTADIDITKSICIRGQGVGITTIQTVTDSINVFHITASDVVIRNLTIDVTASATIALNCNGTAGSVLTDVRMIDCNVALNSHAGLQNLMRYEDAGGEIRDCILQATSTDNQANILRMRANATAEATTTLNLYNVQAPVCVAGGATAATGYDCNDNGTGEDAFLNLYGCTVAATDGGGISIGLRGFNGGDSIVTAYNCQLSGGNTDVLQSDSATVMLRDCVLVNGTTSGTITHNGQNVTASLHVDTAAADYGDTAVIIAQDDEDESFTDYIGTSAADATKNISTMGIDQDSTAGTVAAPDHANWDCKGLVKIEINGADYWIPAYQPN